MPRTARDKSHGSTYHVMCRAISDTKLFINDDDKKEYLKIMKDYQDILHFDVYAYCLMDTHCHFIIYANGADISKIMHDINQKYAQHYFNKVHKRRGHLFADRFKSKIITDESHLITAWSYTHNNPHDIRGFANKVQNYPYSSFGIFLGIKPNLFNLIDTSYVTSMFSNDIFVAREIMIGCVKNADNPDEKAEFEFELQPQEYRSEKSIIIRDVDPDKILNYVAAYHKCEVSMFYMKYNKCASDMRCICVYLLKSMSGYTEKQICKLMGDITQAGVSYMLNKSLKLIRLDNYKDLLNYFLTPA